MGGKPRWPQLVSNSYAVALTEPLAQSIAVPIARSER
jgi:hypothetical protein